VAELQQSDIFGAFEEVRQDNAFAFFC